MALIGGKAWRVWKVGMALISEKVVRIPEESYDEGLTKESTVIGKF